MIEALYGMGLLFGILAGLNFGLPAFAAGLVIALVAVVGIGIFADHGFLRIGHGVLILAVTLQVSYIFGLCAKAVFTFLRKRLNQHEPKPAPREFE